MPEYPPLDFARRVSLGVVLPHGGSADLVRASIVYNSPAPSFTPTKSVFLQIRYCNHIVGNPKRMRDVGGGNAGARRLNAKKRGGKGKTPGQPKQT